MKQERTPDTPPREDTGWQHIGEVISRDIAPTIARRVREKQEQTE